MTTSLEHRLPDLQRTAPDFAHDAGATLGQLGPLPARDREVTEPGGGQRVAEVLVAREPLSHPTNHTEHPLIAVDRARPSAKGARRLDLALVVVLKRLTHARIICQGLEACPVRAAPPDSKALVALLGVVVGRRAPSLARVS